jgi:DNA-binding response OmpR family regulator
LTKSTPLTILVLEDEPLVMTVFQHVLQLNGYLVLAVGSATEAIDEFRRHQQSIDLLIADLAVPDGSGVAVGLGCLRASARLRVLLTSGSPPTTWSQADRDNFELLPQERVGFLQKPFPPGVLLARVTDLIRPVTGMGAWA